MKILSLKQPFAWLVVQGHKDVENRVWNTKHRGPFLVHASKSMTRDYYDWAASFTGMVDPRIRLPSFEELSAPPHSGGIVGQASVTEVIRPCLLGSDVDEDVWCRCGHPWHMGHQYGFLLADARPLPFRPLRGMQNFFTEKAPPLVGYRPETVAGMIALNQAKPCGWAGCKGLMVPSEDEDARDCPAQARCSVCHTPEGAFVR